MSLQNYWIVFNFYFLIDMNSMSKWEKHPHIYNPKEEYNQELGSIK